MQQDRSKRLNNMISGMGKMPPQAVDFEEVVLGNILLYKNAFSEASVLLKEEYFYKENHSKIFKAAQNLFNRSNPIDISTVSQELRKMEELEMVGGSYYLMELTERVKSVTDIEYHCKIIIEKYLQREVIRISSNSVNDGYEDSTDVFELIERTQSQIFNLLAFNDNKDISDMAELCMDVMMDLEEEPVEGLTGVGSGFTDIDRLTGGWQSQDLVIIAARPAMGKTAFMLKNVKNAAIIHKKPVLVFSLEMSKLQLTHRMISDEADVLFERIRKKTLSEYERKVLNTNIQKLKEAPIYIDDTPNLNIFEVRAKARRMKERFGIEMIVIDYLQLMTAETKGKSNNREQEISLISRSLKQLAKELNIPVIALSQLSRAVESRAGANKRPQLSDLRESGSIEQDADMVGFLYRPEYYEIYQDSNGASTIGLCELIFQKNRHGVCDTIKLDFNGAYMRFKDWIETDAFRNKPAFNNIPTEEQEELF